MSPNGGSSVKLRKVKSQQGQIPLDLAHPSLYIPYTLCDNDVADERKDSSKNRPLARRRLQSTCSKWIDYNSKSGRGVTFLWSIISILSIICYMAPSASKTVTWMFGSMQNKEDVLRIVFVPPTVDYRPSHPLAMIPIKHDNTHPDHGGLHINKKLIGKRISIPPDDEKKYEEFRKNQLEEMNQQKIPIDFYYTEELEDTQEKCRRVSWQSSSHPNCNAVHEVLLERVRPEEQEYNVTYLSSGTYRDAWRFQRPGYGEFVLKRLMRKDKFEFQFKDLAKIRKEATIFEMNTASPLILNIYGFCGGSVMLEAMASDLHKKIIYKKGQFSQSELDKMENPSLNNFTTTEKLQISLDMAESLAALHGNAGGQIIHSDTHIEQWLLDRDGTAKLNDFNNAIISTWNTQRGKYCTKKASYGGIYHAPEEYVHGGSFLDEGVDTYSFGNNIYTLLTGLWPFYAGKAHRTKKIQEWLVEGKRPYVDPRFRTRSYIEGNLVEVMEQCWEHDPTKRIDIFAAVQALRRVKVQAIQKGEFVLA